MAVKLNFYAQLLAFGFLTLEDGKDLLVLKLEKIMNSGNNAQVVFSFYKYSGVEYCGLVSQAIWEKAEKNTSKKEFILSIHLQYCQRQGFHFKKSVLFIILYIYFFYQALGTKEGNNHQLSVVQSLERII